MTDLYQPRPGDEVEVTHRGTVVGHIAERILMIRSEDGMQHTFFYDTATFLPQAGMTVRPVTEAERRAS